MSLDDIPEKKTSNFPAGVSEEEFDTIGEACAFIRGVEYADDLDVETAEPFSRNGRYIVRVRVGNWGDDNE